MARKIEIEVVGDTKSLDRALSRTTKSTQSSFQKMGKAAGVAGLAIAGGLAVVAKIGFDELAESQKVMAQTQAVLKSTGGVANVTAKDVDTLASSLSKLSGVDDEAISSSENLLLTFTQIRNEAGKGNAIFDKATKAILDMSVAMGTDLQGATIQVGKALNDPIKGITALTRVGVTFDEATKKQIETLVKHGETVKAQKIILAELNKEFGGSAEAAGETLPGQLNKLKNSFEETAGSLVATLLPTMTLVLDKLARLAAYLQRNPKLLKAVTIGIAALAAALLTASAAQLALNLAVLANPYVAAAVAIIALGVAITILVKKVDFFRQHWQLLLIGIGVGPVLVATAVKAIIRHFDDLKAAFNKVKGVASAVFNFVADQIRGVVNVIQAVIDAIQTLIGWINRIPSIPHIGTDNPQRADPRFRGASGGIVTRPTVAMIGERGPEAVIPLNRAPGARPLAAGGAAGEVRVIVVGGDPQAIRYFQGLFNRYARGNGGKGVF